MIISASRRTDIPAFYARWFMRRIAEGFVVVRNPRNARQFRRIELDPECVDALIFWTRNSAPLMTGLRELDALGYRYLFHYTITGYPRALEPHVPELAQAIRQFGALSEQIGPGRLAWRYDPILFSNLTPPDDQLHRFAAIARQLAGQTQRVVISLCDLYAKSCRNLDAIPGLIYQDPGARPGELAPFLRALAEIAQRHGMTIHSCAETQDFSAFGIAPGKCIDEQWLGAEFGLQLAGRKDPGQRPACRCIPSVDIGQYHSCLHGCVYCYATGSLAVARQQQLRHDPDSPLLIGPASDVPACLLQPGGRQASLF